MRGPAGESAGGAAPASSLAFVAVNFVIKLDEVDVFTERQGLHWLTSFPLVSETGATSRINCWPANRDRTSRASSTAT